MYVTFLGYGIVHISWNEQKIRFHEKRTSVEGTIVSHNYFRHITIIFYDFTHFNGSSISSMSIHIFLLFYVFIYVVVPPFSVFHVRLLCNFSVGYTKIWVIFFLSDLTDTYISLMCVYTSTFLVMNLLGVFSTAIITHVCANFWSCTTHACSRNFNGKGGGRDI